MLSLCPSWRTRATRVTPGYYPGQRTGTSQAATVLSLYVVHFPGAYYSLRSDGFEAAWTEVRLGMRSQPGWEESWRWTRSSERKCN